MGTVPRKLPPGPLTIVEEAPSHDGALTFAAYERRWPGMPRPLHALRIYDTTPAAGAPNRAAEVAKIIHEKTAAYRGNRRAEDRVEVLAMPMPSNATDQQRADKCREHQIAEVQARGGSGKEDWGEWALPPLAHDDCYQQGIIVIDRLDDGWEGAFERPRWTVEGISIINNYGYKTGGWEWEGSRNLSLDNPPHWRENPFGTFLYVDWDLRLSAEERAQSEEEGDPPLPEIGIQGFALVTLDRLLASMRESLATWYIDNSPEWYRDRERAA